MKESISGAEFSEMDAIDIEFDGYLVDYEVGTDAESVWNTKPME